jgi:predicted nuclease of predicted toxin-antitoxin system
MRLLADMGISMGLVYWLRSAGHEVIHLQEQRLHRLPDGDIFAKAAGEHRVILTFDLDFSEIVALSHGANVSAIIYRLNNTRTTFVIERTKNVLQQASDALDSGAIVIVEDSRIRIRRLPIA